jgi:hypothetical protein
MSLERCEKEEGKEEYEALWCTCIEEYLRIEQDRPDRMGAADSQRERIRFK